jgi:hypothetical protein
MYTLTYKKIKKELHNTVGAILSTIDVACLLYTQNFKSTARDVMNSGKTGSRSKSITPS